VSIETRSRCSLSGTENLSRNPSADRISLLSPGLVSFILIDFEPGRPHGRSSSGGLFHFQTRLESKIAECCNGLVSDAAPGYRAARLVAAELVRH
jgi:hypothetical protein